MIQTDPLSGARGALLDHPPKAAILARYQVAGGQERVSGKFANPESSAGLVSDHAAAPAAQFEVGAQ